jgi:glutathione S-transferase
MLKLYYAPGACSLASHIALEEAGARYEIQRVDFKAGEQRSEAYLRVNPKGRVPALVTDRGVLTENPAILAYIAQTFREADLADVDDPFAFAELQAFNLWLATHVHVAFAHVFRPGRYADGEDCAAEMRAKSSATLDEAFAALERRFETGGPFVHGQGYTVCDAYLFVFETWLFTRGVGHPERCPMVRAHHDLVAARPAVQRVLAAEATR